MAKKKKRNGSKQGMFSKAVNIGILALGMSRILEIIFNNLGNPSAIPTLIIRGATAGLSTGSFSLKEGVRFYGPPASAAVVKGVFSWLRKKNPVR